MSRIPHTEWVAAHHVFIGDIFLVSRFMIIAPIQDMALIDSTTPTHLFWMPFFPCTPLFEALVAFVLVLDVLMVQLLFDNSALTVVFIAFTSSIKFVIMFLIL